MRKPWLWSTVLLVAIAVIALVVWPRGVAVAPSGSVDAAAEATAQERMAEARQRVAGLDWSVAALPAARGARVLRGFVHGPGGGPVEGAQVIAAVAAEGETLSELGCNCGNRCGMKLLACGCGEAAGQIVELVTARRGESIPVGRGLTASDGSFALEGLSDDVVTLWAEKPGTGIALMTHVSIDSEPTVVLAPSQPLAGRVVRESGQPVEGAVVTAVFAQHSRFFDVISDPDGRFSYPALPEGEFRLVAVALPLLPEAPKVKTGEDREVVLTLAEPRRIAGRVERDGQGVPDVAVTLSGQHRKETVRSGPDGRFDFEGLRKGSYELVARGEGQTGHASIYLAKSLEETVVVPLGPSSAIDGYVRDERGAPVEGARVYARRQITSVYTDRLSVDTYTDASGRYRFDLSGDGEIALSASKSGYLEADAKVQLLAGQGIQAPALVIALGAIVRGQVLDEGGQPVHEASITLFLDHQQWTAERGEAPQRATQGSAESDAAGAFEVKGLEPGAAYDVRISAAGFLADSAEVRAGGPDVRWVLHRGASISGVVLDQDGRVVPGARVHARPVSEGDEAGDGANAETDAKGRFVLSGLSPGEFMVIANRKGGAPFTSVSWAPTSARVAVGSRQQREVILRFTGTEAVHGYVRTAEGEAIAGATVVLVADDGDDEDSRPGGGMAQTDAQGAFSMRDLTPGAYTVRARAREHVSGDPIPVRVPADQPVLIVLQRSGGVVGRVVGVDGAPLTHFSINLSAVRHPEGKFELPVHRDGKLEVTVGAPAHAHRTLEVDVLKGGRLDLGDVRLEHGRAVRGAVADAAGLPVAGALVDVGPIGQLQAESLYLSERFGAVKTDAHGRFVLPNVGSVPHVLAVQSEAHPPHRQELPATVSEVAVRLTAGAQLHGRVAGRDGRGIGGVTVMAKTPMGWPQAETHADGTWELKALAPGRVTLIVMPDEPGTPSFAPRVLELTGGQTVRVDFQPGPADCDVALLADVGPLGMHGRAMAMLLPPGTPPITSMKELVARTPGALAEHAAGRFTFVAVPPGDYVVEVLVENRNGMRLFREAVSVGSPCPAARRLELRNPQALAMDGIF